MGLFGTEEECDALCRFVRSPFPIMFERVKSKVGRETPFLFFFSPSIRQSVARFSRLKFLENGRRDLCCVVVGTEGEIEKVLETGAARAKRKDRRKWPG